MSEIAIRTSQGSYQVIIGRDILGAFPDPAFCFVDAAIAPTLPTGVPMHVVVATESNKTLATCEGLLVAMREAGLSRDSDLLAVGGGTVQDIATLAASLYMRGIGWRYAPTTLMGMLDSCIGGKSSINVGAAKNLIGNIYPPTQVVIDLRFTDSLTPAAVAAGMAEAVKICFARGHDAFDRFASLRTQVGDGVASVELVEHVLRSKQWFIEVDEFDAGPRRLLNFGHTFGHALESATGWMLPHGIAVAVGMLAAIAHPLAVSGGPERELRTQIEGILAPALDIVRSAARTFDESRFVQAFENDKKHSRTHYRLVLPNQGALAEVAMPREPQSVAVAIAAIRDAFDWIGA